MIMSVDFQKLTGIKRLLETQEYIDSWVTTCRRRSQIGVYLNTTDQSCVLYRYIEPGPKQENLNFAELSVLWYIFLNNDLRSSSWGVRGTFSA